MVQPMSVNDVPSAVVPLAPGTGAKMAGVGLTRVNVLPTFHLANAAPPVA
jgi:hypothetical protein